MKKISIIIPFYNEKFVLNKFIDNLTPELKKLKNKYSFEVILLDNNSDDGSSLDAINIAKKNNFIYKCQNRNFGYQANILTGYDICTGDAAIQINADGEDNPNLIYQFINKWEEGFDVVYGVIVRRKESFILEAQRKIFYRLINFLSDINIPIDSGDFRLIDRKIINQIKNFKESNIYLRGIISYIGGKQIGIDYKRDQRYGGNSKFSWFRYVSFATNAILSFTNKPLHLVSTIGFIISFISLIGIIIYLFMYLLNYIPVDGFTTLIIVSLLILLIVMSSLSIMSLYISKILDEVRNRPRYILKNEKNSNNRP
jgi:glycosyltransferase involved in cell wall biosynthesis